MVLHLDVIAVAKHFLVPRRDFFGFVVLALAQSVGYFATNTATKYNQTFAVFLEHYMVEPRLVVKTLQVSDSAQTQQVLVASVVHG